MTPTAGPVLFFADSALIGVSGFVDLVVLGSRG